MPFSRDFARTRSSLETFATLGNEPVRGTIPTEVGILTSLTSIDVGTNALVGTHASRSCTCDRENH
jgi:hypothetical protein